MVRQIDDPKEGGSGGNSGGAKFVGMVKSNKGISFVVVVVVFMVIAILANQ